MATIRRLLRIGWRQLILLTLMLGFSYYVVRGLLYWQVTEHTRVAQAAAQIYDSLTDLPARRGGIVDATGMPLVSDTAAYKLAADPNDIKNLSTPQRDLARYNAAKLARVLRRDPGPIYHLLQYTDLRYVVIARQVDLATGNAIKALRLPGIILSPTYRAVYPQGQLAAGVLGFVDDQGVGQYGIEQSYNDTLTGRDGSQFVYVDTANRSLPVGVEKPHLALNGATLSLTIDVRIQSVVERRLAAAVKRYGAESASAVVMDPKTGAILAMASLPSYDPNHFSQPQYTLHPAVYNNLAVQSYQPGSTFKIVSVAAGLDSHAFTPQTTIYDPGFYHNYDITVHNWDSGSGWGYETPEIMLRHSANVGMAQFVNMMSPLTYYDYVLNRFGFGYTTGIDLPNESPGYVRSPTHGPWQMMDLLTNSYGQGINVTPLQMTDAVAALANGGVRMRPYVVNSITYTDRRKPDWHATPKQLGRVVSAQTAATMTQILQRSAVDGEATCALTNNYPVAAKTGTATIEDPAAHGMDFTKGTVASLIGYAPINDPKFVMLVEIRHPQPGPGNNNIWGSVVAAPAWHDIATSLYRMMSLAPQPGSTPDNLANLQGPHQWACSFMPQ